MFSRLSMCDRPRRRWDVDLREDGDGEIVLMRVDAPSHEQAGAILAEFAESGLALDALGGNSAKLRLSLDLASMLPSARAPLHILDVGCAGPLPLNLWEPFVPLARKMKLVGVDVAGLDHARARSAALGDIMEVHEADASNLTKTFGPGTFDVVVSTQVLEHLPNWQLALGEMTHVLRAGGTLLVTCDSGEFDVGIGGRARLVAKRAYARLTSRRPWAGRFVGERLSGQWQRAPRRDELRKTAERFGLDVERLQLYCIGQVKRAERSAGTAARQLWLALEEALPADELDPIAHIYAVIYLRAQRAR
jgi:SAM-dependent methyltransferase